MAPPQPAQRVRDLFDRVLAEPPERRALILDAECSADPVLRRDVEGLLRAAEEAGDFLSTPAGWAPPSASILDSPTRGSASEPDVSAPLLSPGQLLAGRYRIERLIGRGGMGEVYETADLELGTRVALKTVRPATAAQPGMLERFKREVLLARRVTHPCACRAFDLGRDTHDGADVTFLTMELLSGEPLSRRLRARGPLAPAEALALLRDLAGALDAAHRAGVVHRDLKPANVLIVGAPGAERAVVTDFGLADDATAVDDARDGASVRGTAEYLAPEQVTGDAVGPRADVYALGVLLFEALTGGVPFRRESPLATAFARLDDAPPRLRDVLPEVDARWDAAIARCLARNPEDRFESAGALAAFVGDDAPTPAVPVPGIGRVPQELDAFVGRERELAELERLVGEDPGVVTLTGPAGTGKTRLATRHAALAWTRWAGGVWFCDLAEARHAEGVARAVGDALGVALGSGDPIEQLGNAIAARGRCLVVLDDFEHVAHLAADLVGRWREIATEATFLVTSRERLRVPGERVVDLAPLGEEDGASLFVARALARRPGFEAGPGAAPEIRELVRRLDGLPLAIELAASRVQVLSVPQIRSRLDERFRLLASAGASGRHASLHAAIDTSWELLRPWEQAAFAQASVFEGGFPLEAAEDVLDLSSFPDAPWIVDVLQSLVDKSLLRVESVGSDGATRQPRFRMLASLQEHARGKLPPEESRRVRDRHARHHARLGDDAAIESLDLHGGTPRRRLLAREQGNVLAAFRHAVDASAAELATPLFAAAWAILDLAGPMGTAVDLGRRLLALPGLSDAQRASAARFVGTACWRAGRIEEARAHYEDALQAARRSGNRRAEGIAIGNLGNLHFDQGRMDAAQEQWERARGLHRETGNRRFEGLVLSNLGNVHLLRGSLGTARGLYESAVAIAREVGDRRAEGVALGNLAYLVLEQGELDEARSFFDAALTVHREVGNRRFEGEVLGNLAGLDLQQGRLADAGEHVAQALAIARESGDRRAEGVWLGNLGNVHAREGRLAQARESHERALALHRELGNASFEAEALGRLGRLDLAEGRLDSAGQRLQDAALLHRRLGEPRSEGETLGAIAALATRTGDVQAARDAFAAGEALLRGGGYRIELATLLCARAGAEASWHELEAAHASLAEAEELAAAAGAGPHSELGRAIAAARAAIARHARPS